MESKLKYAERYAKEGNRTLMENYIREANQHMSEALVSAPREKAHLTKIEEIRHLMSPQLECNYHSSKMEFELKNAECYAKEGNRSLMEYSIEKANQHMSKATVSAPREKAHLAKIEEIHSLMSPQLEYNYHLSKMESELKNAECHAKEGNRSLMEYSIKKANKHSEKAESISQKLNGTSN